MKVKNSKVFSIDAAFSTKSAEDGSTSIFIEGHASTNDVDRVGDVVPTAVWEKGIVNYLNNPVILAFHHHSRPVGRMVDHSIDEKGLWIKARISDSDEEIYKKVKDEVITGFSVSFRTIDAEYNSAADVFVIKELELIEISVVSVPMNKNTLFSLAKSFDTEHEYNLFKQQFEVSKGKAKGLETDVNDSNSKTNKDDIDMTPEELKALVAKAAHDATTAMLAEQKKIADELEEKRLAEEKFNLAVKAAASASAIEVGKSGAEKLLADIEARFEKQDADNKSAIAGLEEVIKQKAVELEAIQRSKMTFDNGSAGGVSASEKETAVLLSQLSGKSIDSTDFGKKLLEKAGAHVASATWELEVSLNMESEVRRRLVVAPTLRNIAMKTNVQTIPLNPEAGVATWITNAQFGTTDSPGDAQTHQLGEITLNAYKVATREYTAYEEEEDALLAIVPIIRDAMIRRVARAVDRAFLRGEGAGADPVKGLAVYDASSTVTAAIAAAATVGNMKALRRDLGAWGLDPSEIRFIVSTDIYYDLLEDVDFATVDKVGDRATLLTGQIGQIGNTPVIVSAEFEAKADTKIGAIAFAPANFLVGNQRGLRMEMDSLVETQRKVMVASLRTGLTQISTNLGAGVSTFRWTAT